jgi:hypothetical protein
VISPRELNRALLARQGLLEPIDAGAPEALKRLGGLQAQYAPSPYIGLWSRLAAFERRELTDALHERTVIQATLMRITIHVVAREDYWPFAIATREARRTLWLRANRGAFSEAELQSAAEKVREAGGPLTRAELDALVGKPLALGAGLWVDLVRVPPSGTWERRRADVFGVAEDWIGPPPALSPEEAAEHLVHRYLRAFGPATAKDISSYTGLPVKALPLAGLEDRGDKLLDVPGAPLPDGDTPAPVRFLPPWDAALLVHARRTGVLPEEHRPKVFSVKTPHSMGVYLVDGAAAGAWRPAEGGIALTPWVGGVPPEVQEEADRLAAFVS